MSLFDIKAISEKLRHTSLPENKAVAFSVGLTPSPRLIHSIADLRATLGELEKNKVMPFTTRGNWSMHQLIEYIILQTGPAKMWMTTWTITEEPMRALLDMITTCKITELTAIFDYRIERRKPEAFQLASNIVTRIALTKCHAKVVVLQNEDWSVSVMGSANFSNNPRLEAGVIFTDKETAAFNIAWIHEEMQGKEVKRAQ
jgi:hypothetical protein